VETDLESSHNRYIGMFTTHANTWGILLKFEATVLFH